MSHAQVSTPKLSERQFPPRSYFLAIITIFAAAIMLYANTLQTPFIFDDGFNIVENYRIRLQSLDFTSMKNAVRGVPTRNRPLTGATFALNYYFGGYDVFGYHLVNVLIHAANGIFVYLLALAVFGRLRFRERHSDGSGTAPGAGDDDDNTLNWMALGAALVFACHPLQTQAVTYVAQRYTSMAALFYLAAVLCFIGARSAGRGEYFSGGGAERALEGEAGAGKKRSMVSALYAVLCPVCGVLAMLCKQSAASLPAAILLVEYLLFDSSWAGWKRKLLYILPLAAVFIVVGLYVAGFFSSDMTLGMLLEDVSDQLRETQRVSRWEYLCTQFAVVAVYLKMLVLPIGQNVDHMFPFSSGFWDGLTPYAFLLLSAVVAAAVWARRRHPVVTFAVFWFFITLSVESSIFPIKDALVEHRLYLPLAGMCLLPPYLFFTLLRRRRWAAVVLTALVVIALATATVLRNRVWAEPVTFWADVVDKSPQNYRALNNLGLALSSEGRAREALPYFQEAVRIRPNDSIILSSYGSALNSLGQFDQAIDVLRHAVAVNPEQTTAHYHLGVALVGKGRYGEAVDHLKRALDRRSNDPSANYYYGLAAARLGRFDEAEAHFKRVLDKQPENAEVLYNLGAIEFRQGRLDKAAEHFEALLRVRPDNAGAQFSLGLIATHKGRTDEAVRHYEEGLRLDPGNAEAHNNLGVVLARAGRFREAAEQFSKALQIRPDYVKAREGLQAATHQLAASESGGTEPR